MSEAVRSTGNSQGCYADEVRTCDYSGCAVRLLSDDGRLVPVGRRESFILGGL